MPHLVRPIATVEELVARAQITGRQAARVLQLLDLPFAGIDPRNLMSEFNELFTAAVRLLGCECVVDFFPYNLALAGRDGSHWPPYRRLALKHTANTLQRLARHLVEACRCLPTVVGFATPSLTES